MAKIYDTDILFDPLYREIIDGLGEMVQESASMDMADVAVELKKCQQDIKKEAIRYSVR